MTSQHPGPDSRISSRWRTRIAQNRRLIDVELAGEPEARKRISPIISRLTDELSPRLVSHAHGQLLDAGCGTQPFRTLVEGQVDRYLTLDVEARVDDVDFVGDVENMAAIGTRSMDTVLCSEVLEHVPHPAKAISEFARIVKPGGVVLLTVPFLARLHEEPHDYFRYTRHGLHMLLDEGGFEVKEIVETGSLFCFVGHQVSLALLGLTWHLRWLRRVTVGLNSLLVVQPATALDRLSRMGRLLPLGYVVVATRREVDAG